MWWIALALALPVSATAPASIAASLSTFGQDNVPNWSEERHKESDITVRYYQGFSECIVNRWPEKAEAFLVSLPGSDAYNLAARQLMDDAGLCVFSGAVRMSRRRLHGFLAEALIKKGRKPLPAAWLSPNETPASLVAKIGATSTGNLGQQQKRFRLGREVAFCTVQQSGVLVENLLQTRPTSSQEQAALRSLNPIMSRCLGGRHMRYERALDVRASLMEALYWQRGSEGRADA
jgi:hypothetical protein